MAEQSLYSQADWLQFDTALRDGGYLLALHHGGITTVMRELAKYDPRWIRGEETDGSMTTVFVEHLTGWSIAPASAFISSALHDTGSEPELPGLDGSADDAAYVNQWQALFMALRAACDKSEDPDVAAAVADLEAHEAENATGG